MATLLIAQYCQSKLGNQAKQVEFSASTTV